MAAPCDDFIKIVAICDCCARQKQQHFRQREGNPPGLPTILDLREMPEENGQA
jgi:thymidine kinase